MLINGSVGELELMRWGLFGVHWYWSPGIGLTWEWALVGCQAGRFHRWSVERMRTIYDLTLMYQLY